MNIDYLKQGLLTRLLPYLSTTKVGAKTIVEKAVTDAILETEATQILRSRLYSGAVHFRYKKSDGSIRDAIGTLNTSVLSSFQSAAKTRRYSTTDCFCYFDLVKMDWRSFIIGNFIEIVE